MAFTPILSSQPISYVRYKSAYRNSARENLWGVPVYFVPFDYSTSNSGYGGAKYQYGYNYDNSPSSYNGNCTWWCWGRLYDAEGTYLNFIDDASNWYDNYTGSKSRNADNIKAGDIIVLTDGGDGHVMFVEKVDSGTVYISQSAYSRRSVWDGMACLTTSYDKLDIYYGNSIDIYKDIDSAPAYQNVVGVIHTGSGDPPVPPTEDLTITITPSSYSVVMDGEETYKDFTFNIAVSGLPDGATVSGGNTYPDLVRVYNSGWSYTDYDIGGVTYRTATKTQTLRYNREYDYAYTTTKHMYFNLSYSTGTVSTDTPMYIDVKARFKITTIIAGILNNRRRRKKGYVSIR